MSTQPTTLLLRSPASLIPGLVRITIAPSDEAVAAWRGLARPPGAPPLPPPSVGAAARATALLPPGVAVALTAGAVTVLVYCLKPAVASTYKALATGASAAGLAIGDVKSSVSLAPPPVPEAGRALFAAVAAGLARSGWSAAAATASEASPPTLLLDASPLTAASPLACTILCLASADPRPPSDIVLTLSVCAGRARRLACLSLQGATPDPPTVARELTGVRCALLPDFSPHVITHVQGRYEGDESLVTAWEAVLGGTLSPPPSLWVWVVPPADGEGATEENEGRRAAPGALCVPPVALWEAPGLISLPPESRAGGGGAALVRSVASAVEAGGVFGELEVVGLVQQQQKKQHGAAAAAAALFTSASRLGPGGGGGWEAALPHIEVEALPVVAAAAAARQQQQQQQQENQARPHPSATLQALLAEASAKATARPVSSTLALAAAQAALASAAARPPPGGIPRLGVRVPFSAGQGGARQAAPVVAGRGGGGGKKRVAGAAPADAAGASAPAPKPAKAPKAAPSVADAAAAVAKVRAAAAAEGRAGLSKLRVDDLKAFCKASGLAVGGKKEVLVGRVLGVVGKENGGAAGGGAA